MANRLSHSSVTKYQGCPTEWNLHYRKHYRAKLTGSALLFGSAVDKAFEALAQGEDPYAAFDKMWAFQEINKKYTSLPESELVVYSNSEFDADLLTPEHMGKLTAWVIANESTPIDPLTLFKEIAADKKEFGFKLLTSECKRFYNLANWCCLERKGHLMIEAMKDKILPQLSKIHATQKKIELTNDNGDSVIGFADLVASYGPHEENVVVFDLKTSSINYEKDAVLTSSQLSLYVHALSEEYKTRKAGFIVLNKRVMKNKTKACSVCGMNGTGSRARTCDAEIEGRRCGEAWTEVLKPEIFVQIIVDEIPVQMENMVMENIDNINKMLDTGIFIRNFDSCEKPWGKCTFFDACHNGNFDDVETVEPTAVSTETPAPELNK